MNNSKIDEIQEDIRQLRESDHHVCQHSLRQEEADRGVIKEDASEYCSCQEYDRVIDKLEKLKDAENS
jgi:hypothetical protein